jgi:hypothetical protein
MRHVRLLRLEIFGLAVSLDTISQWGIFVKPIMISRKFGIQKRLMKFESTLGARTVRARLQMLITPIFYVTLRVLLGYPRI